jgi:phage/plasmid primase-like uncharacterized protein
MRYLTFDEQTIQHLQFLQKEGLDVRSLTIDSPNFIRCKAFGESGRGEYTYKTVSRTLDNGMSGLLTWCRGHGGQVQTFKTYGLWASKNEPKADSHFQSTDEVLKAQKFWEYSSKNGSSDYLKAKNVGAYGIRFRENQYGKVAVVPLRDIKGTLLSYQILNANGSKIFAKGTRLIGLFHQLTTLSNGLPIGIAEGYATGATCFELTGIAMVIAFTSENLYHVIENLHRSYPNSPLILFADNDRHLEVNKGEIAAHEALKVLHGGGIVLSPYFDGYPASKDYTDWNDLVREIGKPKALEQIQNGLSGLSNWMTTQYKNIAS